MMLSITIKLLTKNSLDKAYARLQENGQSEVLKMVKEN